ncbi:MAG: hypothetical protein ACUVTH_00970 [Thermogutta sp.]
MNHETLFYVVKANLGQADLPAELFNLGEWEILGQEGCNRRRGKGSKIGNRTAREPGKQKMN